MRYKRFHTWNFFIKGQRKLMEKRLILRKISKWLVKTYEGEPILRKYSKRLRGS
jgi:hypothetical protein